jgi:hypothetical protein
MRTVAASMRSAVYERAYAPVRVRPYADRWHEALDAMINEAVYPRGFDRDVWEGVIYAAVENVKRDGPSDTSSS